mmetsp:Transcript_68557/g.155023  ORF Transcript_68557/g.155023 Transcript_68557/m.155023 type:complete len:582 (+) Transcript_68557:147-1892(+)
MSTFPAVESRESEEESDEPEEDEPLLPSSSPRSPARAKGSKFSRWLYRVGERLYGDDLMVHHRDELPRIAYLSATLCCIIGTFWLLDSLKDTIFDTLVGLEHQPKAKVLSVGVTLVLVLYYNRLLDQFSKPAVFYLISVGYAAAFALIALALSNEAIGMPNTASDPRRVLGWISYFAIESFGSLAVAFFWAFANSTCSLELAESGYGLVIAFAQLGAVAGSTLATLATLVGVPALCGLGGLGCLMVAGMVRGYVTLFSGMVPGAPSDANWKKSRESPWSSMCTGLFLVLRYEYLALVFGISCLDEIVLTVLDYEMKVIGRARFGDTPEAAAQFAALMGNFGQVTNTLSFAFSLLGFSLVVRTLGLRRTLRLFPAVMLLAVGVNWLLKPDLWVLFACMSVLKALTYALNEPATELLYMPTTEAVKFKAKAWIDVFGTRAMKAAGGLINNAARDKPALLARYGSVPTLLISLALLGIAVLVGKQFDDLIAHGVTVGDDDSLRPGLSQSGLPGPGGRGLDRPSQKGRPSDDQPSGGSPRVDWTKPAPNFPTSQRLSERPGEQPGGPESGLPKSPARLKSTPALA